MPLTQLQHAEEDRYIQPAKVNNIRLAVAPHRLDPADEPSRQLLGKRGGLTSRHILSTSVPACSKYSSWVVRVPQRSASLAPVHGVAGVALTGPDALGSFQTQQGQHQGALDWLDSMGQ